MMVGSLASWIIPRPPRGVTGTAGPLAAIRPAGRPTTVPITTNQRNSAMSASPAPPADPLPSPNERPGADVVVYDGKCRICTAQVRKLVWWDDRRRLSYLSLHDHEVYLRWPDLPCQRLMDEMVVIDYRGRCHWGPEAIRYLSRRLPRLWWAAPLLHLPGSMYVWRPLYRWVARNRYRFGGGQCDDDACSLHRH